MRKGLQTIKEKIWLQIKKPNDPVADVFVVLLMVWLLVRNLQSDTPTVFMTVVPSLAISTLTIALFLEYVVGPWLDRRDTQ